MATHSSILAWKIPWTEELGRLQSMGSQSDTTEQLNHQSCALDTGAGWRVLQCVMPLWFLMASVFSSFLLPLTVCCHASCGADSAWYGPALCFYCFSALCFTALVLTEASLIHSVYSGSSFCERESHWLSSHLETRQDCWTLTSPWTGCQSAGAVDKGVSWKVWWMSETLLTCLVYSSS